MARTKSEYGVAIDHDHLPALTVSQEDLKQAHDELFGGENDPLGKLISFRALCESDWSHKFDQYYRERVVHVRSNNVLLLRFAYLYEIDLDRIKSPRDLLAWGLHLCEKTWMTTERLSRFIEAVAQIKAFSLHGF